MHNPLTGTRRSAFRLLGLQAVVVAAFALAALAFGTHAALAVAIGGAAVLLGNALLAWRALGGGVRGAGPALVRVLGGVALKWLVVLGALSLALASGLLPPLALLVGVAVALATGLLGFGIKS